MVPIFSADKHTTITIKLEKFIFSALLYGTTIGWRIIVRELVNREAVKLRGTKGCPLTPFLYHLYSQYRCLTNREWVRLEKHPAHPDRNPAWKQANNPTGEDSPDERDDEQGDRSQPSGQEAS
jgi:hypothetical protein